ncbi:MAG: hypothetical protein U1E26_09195 [Coriobacteriia bacterium]|nr:hypothetical protein [Coriobacteriia bacterium]
MNWVLIPARRGSKGVPGKNTRLLAGVPLITYAYAAAARAFGAEAIVVSTDEPAVARLAPDGATVIERPAGLAGDATTLDEVATAVARELISRGALADDVLLTVQPTSPFIEPDSLRRAAAMMHDGAGSVLSVTDDRHLRWTLVDGVAEPLFTERVNRQWLAPTFAETGGVIAARLGAVAEQGTRILEPVELLELDAVEALDIDTFADWAVAEHFAARRSIVIRADGAPTLGMGHVYRALALEHALAAHDLVIVTRGDGDHALGADFLEGASSRVVRIADEEAFFALLAEREPDVVVLDILDTERAYVERVKAHAGWTVCIEDLGEGSHVADLVINDLYTDFYPRENHWYGVQYALLGPQFEATPAREGVASEVQRVLVTFGGSDPCDLTRLALSALAQCAFAGEIVCVLGPGYSHDDFELAEFGLTGSVHRAATNLAEIMHDSDIALTSAGRTVTELMTQGVPTLALCQNERELTHTHASGPFGVMNLGLGAHVTVDGLAGHLAVLMEDERLRRSMHDRMRKAVAERSNHAIAEMILASASERGDA